MNHFIQDPFLAALIALAIGRPVIEFTDNLLDVTEDVYLPTMPASIALPATFS